MIYIAIGQLYSVLKHHVKEIQNLLNLQNAKFVGAASDKAANQKKVQSKYVTCIYGGRIL
jgi:F0F1-type ATP synthase alpha subunit